MRLPLSRLWHKPSGIATVAHEGLSEARDDLLRGELEGLPAAVAVEDALAEEQKDLAERDVARRVFDHPADRVGIADEKRRAVLAEGHRPRVPHPEAVLGPRLGLALRVGEHEIAAPGRLLAARHPAPVLLGHLAIAPPQELAEAHLARHHDRLAVLLRPVERGLPAVGEAGVDGDRILQRARGDADLGDGAVGAHAAPVLQVDRVLVRLPLALRGKRPVLAPEREGVLLPGRLDDRDAFLEELAVPRVIVAPAVPRSGRLRPGDGRVVLEPARLVAAHERHVEPAAEQVVERRGVLGHAQGIVGGQDVAELIDAQSRAVLAEEHRHEARVLTELEALDLQVVLRNADARPAGLIARARILRDLVQHSLVEHRVLAGHAPLELMPPADGDVHERVEIHGPARLPAAALLVKLRVVAPSGPQSGARNLASRNSARRATSSGRKHGASVGGEWAATTATSSAAWQDGVSPEASTSIFGTGRPL